jgi:phage major head subunit gpT-like protein
MIINHASLSALFQGFKREFQAGFAGVDPVWPKIATRVPSSTAQELYAWLEDFPAFREWFGSRQIKDMKAESYTIINRLFESTVSVKRTTIEDDTFGTYAPIFRELGAAAARHADELIFQTLAANPTGFDGIAMFATNHPMGSGTGDNIDTSANVNEWYLFDTSRPMKPLIYQQRMAAELESKTNPADSDDVFLSDRYIYGGRIRDAGGVGFWQLAFQSTKTLDATAFDAHLADMMAFTSDNGAKLGVKPTLMVVGPSNRAAAKVLLESQYLASGATNTNFQAVDLLVTPYLT